MSWFQIMHGADFFEVLELFTFQNSQTLILIDNDPSEPILNILYD